MIQKYINDLEHQNIPKLSTQMQNKKYHHKFSKFEQKTERINLMQNGKVSDAAFDFIQNEKQF